MDDLFRGDRITRNGNAADIVLIALLYLKSDPHASVVFDALGGMLDADLRIPASVIKAHQLIVGFFHRRGLIDLVFFYLDRVAKFGFGDRKVSEENDVV